MSKECCSCWDLAEYMYEDKYYCDECLLEALEKDMKIKSEEINYKQYCFVGGDYIGDDYEDIYEIIDTCIANIPEIQEVRTF